MSRPSRSDAAMRDGLLAFASGLGMAFFTYQARKSKRVAEALEQVELKTIAEAHTAGKMGLIRPRQAVGISGFAHPHPNQPTLHSVKGSSAVLVKEKLYELYYKFVGHPFVFGQKNYTVREEISEDIKEVPWMLTTTSASPESIDQGVSVHGAALKHEFARSVESALLPEKVFEPAASSFMWKLFTFFTVGSAYRGLEREHESLLDGCFVTVVGRLEVVDDKASVSLVPHNVLGVLLTTSIERSIANLHVQSKAWAGAAGVTLMTMLYLAVRSQNPTGRTFWQDVWHAPRDFRDWLRWRLKPKNNN